MTPGKSVRAEDKPPAPEEVTLECKDGLQMKATYFAGTKGKETVPVIILHGWKENRKDYAGLAQYLQTQFGHAVLLPDMRGHGESTKIKRMGFKDEIVDAGKFRPTDFDQLVNDVCGSAAGVQPAVRGEMKQFLMEKHNSQLLNIDKLCLIGSELGATVSIKSAANDWSWPDLAGRKQGRDVKALFLISPESNFKGLNAIKDLDDPSVQREMSIFFMAGKNGPAAKDAERMYAKLKPYHVEPPKDEIADKKDLFFWQFDTPLQGSKLLAVSPLKGHDASSADKTDRDVNYRDLVAGFIELRLVKKDYRWALRKLPGQE